jgi:uncharacterized membrane protein YgcG
MQALCVACLFITAWAMALDYPKPYGFVNDFANQIPPDAAQALERKLRDYQRGSGKEIRVAVVSTLDGMPVDQYATGMFRAWGVGAVLVLWAPKERQIRIQVGHRFEDVLSDSIVGAIVGQVRSLFRDQHYEEGINAAVDATIAVLGPAAAIPAAPSAVSPAPLPNRVRERTLFIALGGFIVLGVGLWFIAWLRLIEKWRRELPRITASGERALTRVELKYADANAALKNLRADAPKELWRELEVRVDLAAAGLDGHRGTLATLRQMPSGTAAEAKARHEKWLDWMHNMDSSRCELQEVRSILDKVRACRASTKTMFANISPTLARLRASGVPGWSEPLLRAAADTHERALRETEHSPPNWLLVHDLLADVRECLKQIENPSRTPYEPVRSWGAKFDSPALAALNLTYDSRLEVVKKRAESGSASDSDTWDNQSAWDTDTGGSDGGHDGGASTGY